MLPKLLLLIYAYTLKGCIFLCIAPTPTITLIYHDHEDYHAY